MAHTIERELIKVTSYKPRKKFDDRQDYLSSILNAVAKLTDDDFENLSDEAAEWANAAIEAHNAKNELPDFDEVEATDDPEEGDDGDEEAEDDDDADDSSDGGDTEGDDDSDDSPDDVADSADDGDDPSEDDDVDDDEESEDEDDESDEPPKARSKAVPRKADKASKANVKPVKAPAKDTKAVAVKRKPADPDEDVILDKWGCMEGSKNGRALALFEKGATAKEVKDEIGGTYYNILKKMTLDGHTLEKDGAIIKLTHKDEKGKKPAPKVAAKAPAKKSKK